MWPHGDGRLQSRTSHNNAGASLPDQHPLALIFGGSTGADAFLPLVLRSNKAKAACCCCPCSKRGSNQGPCHSPSTQVRCGVARNEGFHVLRALQQATPGQRKHRLGQRCEAANWQARLHKRPQLGNRDACVHQQDGNGSADIPDWLHLCACMAGQQGPTLPPFQGDFFNRNQHHRVHLLKQRPCLCLSQQLAGFKSPHPVHTPTNAAPVGHIFMKVHALSCMWLVTAQL